VRPVRPTLPLPRTRTCPAITLEPALDEPGIVGEDGPDLPLTELRDGSILLEFHGADGAKVMIQDIIAALTRAGHDLNPFLKVTLELLEG